MRLLLALLLASPLAAQTVVNQSFETYPGAPIGAPPNNWNTQTPTGWTCPNVGGGHGLQNPTPAQINTGVDGNTVLWMVTGSNCSQDAGRAVAATNYSLTVSVGSQNGFAGAYTVSYAGCSTSGTTSQGALAPITLPCTTPTGEVVVTLSATSGQVIFDNVILTSTPSVILPPVTLSLTTKVVTCVKCDRTDDTPAQGALTFVQGNTSNSFSFASDGTVAVNVAFDMSKDPVVFTVFLTNANGVAAGGSGWQWSIPRASFSAGIATLGTLSFGGVAFTVNSDGSVSFAGFLPA